MQKTFSACAFISVAGAIAGFCTPAQAQHIPPYHGPAAEGQYSQGGHDERAQPRVQTYWGQGATFGPAGGRYIGGPTQYGPAAPSYWTYNRFSNNGFGGLNWYYGPLGGYTPHANPYGSTSYGYPNFGPYYSYVPLAPVIRQTRPYWIIGGDPFTSNGNENRGPQANGAENPQPGAGQGTGRPAGQQPTGQQPTGQQPTGQQPTGIPAQEPVQSNVKILGKAPTTEALRRSIRYQAQGDEWFAKQNYLQAFGHYKDAISAAPSRPEPHFRKALALAATTNYSLAVEEMKRAMRIDPTWPQTGAMLDELFGADNILSKNAVLHKVAAWVREDIRDPDRLFLMGVLLHFNNDPDKSHTFFEAASALSPIPMYAQTFLEVENQQRAAVPVEDPRPAPLDDDNAPAPSPAVRNNGPRFPAAAGFDDLEPAAKSSVKAAPPRPAAPAKVFRNGPGLAPRSEPAKVPEEPRPRPLARNGATSGGAGPGSWA